MIDPNHNIKRRTQSQADINQLASLVQAGTPKGRNPEESFHRVETLVKTSYISMPRRGKYELSKLRTFPIRKPCDWLILKSRSVELITSQFAIQKIYSVGFTIGYIGLMMVRNVPKKGFQNE